MKKIVSMLLLIGSFIYGNDSLDVKVEQDIFFNDGFGMLKAQPILKDVKENIQLIGQYNVNPSNGNVEMKFDKMIYHNQTYNLTEPFIKQARLKNPKNAVLKKDSRIQVAGGSKSEILNILNNQSSNDGGTNNKNGGSASRNAQASLNSQSGNPNNKGGYGYASNSSGNGSGYSNGYANGYLPYNFGNNSLDSGSSSSSPNYSSATTNNDGSCKSPYVKDGVVGVYTSVGGECQLFTAPSSAIYQRKSSHLPKQD